MTDRERFLLLLVAQMASEGMGQRGMEILEVVKRITEDAGIYFSKDQIMFYSRKD